MTRGTGLALTVSTGRNGAGRIGAVVASAKDELTPMEKQLDCGDGR